MDIFPFLSIGQIIYDWIATLLLIASLTVNAIAIPIMIKHHKNCEQMVREARYDAKRAWEFHRDNKVSIEYAVGQYRNIDYLDVPLYAEAFKETIRECRKNDASLTADSLIDGSPTDNPLIVELWEM